MIIWINGPFGGGKTTLSEKLKEKISNSLIFDPEHVGFLIHRFVPESRKTDFQNFPMWRRLVVSYALEFQTEFKKDLIVPMTLVEPQYLDEIFDGLKKSGQKIHHFFLDIDKKTLKNRIQNQVMSKDEKQDNEIRQWRLDQVDRCLFAKTLMPSYMVFLNSGNELPDDLMKRILALVLPRS